MHILVYINFLRKKLLNEFLHFDLQTILEVASISRSYPHSKDEETGLELSDSPRDMHHLDQLSDKEVTAKSRFTVACSAVCMFQASLPIA